MAIYHMNIKTITKLRGQSVAAAVRYIARIGKYRKDDELVYLQSGNMPAWSRHSLPGMPEDSQLENSIGRTSNLIRGQIASETYWDAADRYERGNGRLGKQLEFALPIELTLPQAVAAVGEFVFWISEVEGNQLPFTFGIHRGKGNNPHVHLLLSERMNDGIARSPGQWFHRAGGPNGGARKTTELKSSDWLLRTRELWSKVCNSHLQLAGKTERIDHRSFAEQGVEGIPGQHIGVAGVAMQRKRLRAKRRGEAIESQPNRIARHMRLKSDKERVAEIDRVLSDLDREKTTLLSDQTQKPGVA